MRESAFSLIFTLCTYISFSQCQSCPETTAPSGNANSIWIGAVSSDWDDPANWQDGDLTNGTNEDAIIDPNNYTFAPVIDAPTVNEPDDVFIVNGGVLTIQADFSINDDYTIWGDGSTLIIEGGSNASGDDINLCKGGMINMSGGSFDNTSKSGILRICTANPTAAATDPVVFISGGTFNTNESIAGPGSENSSTGNEGDYISTTDDGTFNDPTDTTLPVELLSFTAASTRGENLLNWQTASEINNSHFEVQRSYNGMEFESIGTVNGFGNSNVIVNYRFVDRSPSKTTFYRLVQFDHNGDSEIHRTLRVENQFESEYFEISYSNDRSHPIIISSQAKIPSIDLYNHLGQLIYHGEQRKHLTLDTGSWRSGIYFIHIRTGTEVVKRKIYLR